MDMSNLTGFLADLSAKDVFAAVLAFEVPIPDAVILAVFAVIGLAILGSQRSAMKAMRNRMEEAYAEELVLANRRVHHVRSDMLIMKREMEHARQRKRGLQRARQMSEKAAAKRPVSVLREVAANGVGRA
jgi:hypothetical protein